MSIATLEGHDVIAVSMLVPAIGPWIADITLSEEQVLPSRCTLTIAGADYAGTIDTHNSGTFGLQHRVSLVAGGDGWRRTVPAKAYHNDLRVRALEVASDAAREVGETLGTFAPTASEIGVDFLRQTGPASRALQQVIGDVDWWVGYDGITQVGSRASITLDADYTVADYNPLTAIAKLYVDDPTTIPIGAILQGGVIDSPLTVRELEIIVTETEFYLLAWAGGTSSGVSRMAESLTRMIDGRTSQRLHGLYRYRITKQIGKRVNITPVSSDLGLPATELVSLFPGVPGIDAVLAVGSQVLVAFADGDPAQPVVTQFVGADGNNFVPQSLSLCGGTKPVARLGDSVDVFGSPLTPFVGTFMGSPITGTFDLATVPLVGVIATASGKTQTE